MRGAQRPGATTPNIDVAASVVDFVRSAPVPVFRPFCDDGALAEIADCLDSGWWGYGPRCRRLEDEFTARGGAALATANCTAALHLAARCLARGPSDEVIVPAVTFVSSAMAFAAAGWRVLVADVDPRTLLLDPREIERLATPRTRAVVCVHLYGQRAATEEIGDACRARGIALVEDCAHRVDLLDDAAPVGDVCCYSFNAVKEVPCGEGGMLWARDADLVAAARAVSNVGLAADTMARASRRVHADYEFARGVVGLKLRLFDLPAALALRHLATLAETRRRRLRTQALYDSVFADADCGVAPVGARRASSGLMYVVRVAAGARDRVRRRLADEGVATSVHYPSLSEHPAFARRDGACRAAETAARGLVTLPSFVGIDDADVLRAAEIARREAGRAQAGA